MSKLARCGFVVGCLALVASACGSSNGSKSASTAASTTSASASASGNVADGGAGSTPQTTVTGDRDATFRYGFSVTVDSLDPLKNSTASLPLLDPLYDALVRRNADGTLSPGIATSWDLSADGSTFTLHLASGRTFQDGSPLDAAAVKANLERAKTLAQSRVAADLSHITGITATDAQTVVITVDAEGGRLAAILSDRGGMMVAPSTFDADAVDRAPVGSGPFTLTSFDPAKLSYSRWADYYDAASTGLAGIDVSILPDDATRSAALQSGQVDAANLPPALRGELEGKGLQAIVLAGTASDSLVLNTSADHLSDSRVRLAISHALDRQSITTAIYQGGCTSSTQPYPEGFWARNTDTSLDAVGTFDVAQAKQLLADAGVPDGFKMQVVVPNIPQFTTLFEALQAALADIGIQAEALVQDTAQFITSITKQETDAYLGSFDASRPDVLAFWQRMYMPGGTYNPKGYSPDGFEALFGQAAAAVDTATQGPIIQQMGGLVLESGPRCGHRLQLADADRCGEERSELQRLLLDPRRHQDRLT
ncbi:MAG: ABC transporter substrate-binding protein [Ilumatobacteraceae bacterium]